MSESETLLLAPAVQTARATLLFHTTSSFASLAIPASLRTGEHGTYVHAGLAERLRGGLFQRALGKLHIQVFLKWLQTPFEDQTIAVEDHLRDAGDASAAGTSVLSFGRFVPEAAELPERQLFEADLSIVLTLVRAEHGDSGAAPNSSWKLLAALHRMRASLSACKLNLKDLSDFAEISPNHLGRMFHHHSGTTFSRYSLAFRMFTAAGLLRSRPVPLKDLAEMLGYRNESNLCRDFKKAFGKSPMRYRLFQSRNS
jgi:AraC-like DNA-binding protein